MWNFSRLDVAAIKAHLAYNYAHEVNRDFYMSAILFTYVLICSDISLIIYTVEI